MWTAVKTTTYIPYSKLQDYNTPNKKKNESSKNLERDASHEEASLKTIHDYGRLTKLGFHCLALSDMPPSAAQTFNEKNPRLAPGQDWQVALSEDMMLVYDAWFEAGKTYEIVLLVD